MKDKPIIEHANESGQGYHPASETHPLRKIVDRYGYKYSHSTPIQYMYGWYLLHTFVNQEHTVSLTTKDLDNKFFHTSCGGSLIYRGYGAKELTKVLKGKAKRYKLNYFIDPSEYECFHVTGTLRNGRKFKLVYKTLSAAWAINLWRGHVWGVKKNGRRECLKTVTN